jgi:hypothetical protein
VAVVEAAQGDGRGVVHAVDDFAPAMWIMSDVWLVSATAAVRVRAHGEAGTSP